MTNTTQNAIFPAYLAREKDRLTDLIAGQLRFLAKTRLNHVLRCIAKPKNGLFNALLPHLYRRDEQTYIGFDDQVHTPGRNHQFIERLIERQVCPSEYQGQAQYFCNAMNFATFHGMKQVRRKGKLVDVEDWRPAPSERVANCGLYVHTIEYDPMRNVQEFLDEQVGWCLAGRSTGGSESALDRLFEQMSRFADFRLMELVWSGHKSCHLNFLFDIRHLASTRFVGSRELAPVPELPDIEDALLRTGLCEAWKQLPALVSAVIETEIDPDSAVSNPETFRRLPWGQREVKPKDVLGFRVGSRVPQIVLWSRGRAYARQATEWFHHPEAFLRVARRKSSRTRRLPSTKTLADEEADAFITALGGLCKRLWGSPSVHPRPCQLLDDKDGFKVTFYNDADDRNPSSVIKGEYNTLLIQGRPPVGRRDRYALPLPLNELVEYWRCQGHLIADRILDEPSTWIERGYFDLIQERPGSERDYLPRTIFTAARGQRLAAILTQEGAGKTTALLSWVPINTEPDAGPLVFASRSYIQAEAKCQEFNSSEALHGGAWRGVMLPSFRHEYERALAGAPQLTPQDIANLGHSSLIEAIYAQGGEIVTKLEKSRKRFLQECERPGSPIFFTVQQVAQQWFRRGGTRLWLHPRFDEYLDLHQCGDVDGARVLADKMYDQMAFHWVIYDEIGTDDLMWVHPEEQVEWVWALQRSLRHEWDELYFKERVHRFGDMLEARPCPGMTFETCQAIIEARYKASDLKIVDPALEPFGVNNTPESPYQTIKGQRWLTKTKDWWIRNRFKITALTTERKPIAAIRAIRERAIQESLDHPMTEPILYERAAAQAGDDQPPPILTNPVYEDVFAVYNFDTSHLMPAEKMNVALIRAREARRGGAAQTPEVVSLCRTIRDAAPDATIVSDIVKAVDVPGVINHSTARGSNEFSGKPLAAVFLHLAPDLYRDLLLEDAHFGLRNAVKLHYIDQFDQTMGRTLGFRHRLGSDAVAMLSNRLWRQIGMKLMTDSRYRIVL